MPTEFRYPLPIAQTNWKIENTIDAVFTWDYDNTHEKLLALYEKGKKQQWNAKNRIDWSIQLDPENPAEMDDYTIPIYGSKVWHKLNHKERVNLRHHVQAYSVSQFLHGEQGALLATAKIVATVESISSKFYAATQVMDEARHVEVFSQLLRDKFGLSYPITENLSILLEQTLSDRRWDMTYLGMQILVEGLALGAFQRIRDMAKNRLMQSILAYVMQDEARHIAFGRLALRDFYPQLTDKERDEREEFVVEACIRMHDRFNSADLWEAMNFPVAECVETAMQSEIMQIFRKSLFSRIVPTIKDIGLWGPRVQKAFTDLGVIALSEVDPMALLEEDAAIANEFDASSALRTT